MAAVTVARLQAVLSAQTRDFDRAMRGSETRMQRTGAAARGLALAGGTVLAGALIKGVREAIEAERETSRLEQAFKNAKIAIDPYRASIESAGRAAIQLGFDDEAATRSLGSLIIATGDYDKAQAGVNVAMDLARFRSIDLETATKTLTMAMGGSQRAVKQLGIEVKPVTTEYDRLRLQFGAHLDPAEKVRLAQAKINDEQRTAEKVIDTVRQKVRGQAEAYSKTAAGEMEVFRAKSEELSEKLGTKLLPVLTDIVGFLSKTIDKLEKTNEFMGKIGANKGLIDIFKDIKEHIPTGPFEKLGDEAKRLWGWLDKVKDIFEWVIKNAGKIGGALGSISGTIGKVIPGGDPKNPFLGPPGAGTGPTDISPKLWDELAGARSFGLHLSSGYRPGAITRSGHPSDHGVYPSKAIDVSGSSSAMAGFFRWLIGQRDVKQAFYDPLGSIFGGILSSYREGGHSDHVHVATYDKGGWLKPGLTLAMNNTGRPERVGGGNTYITIQAPLGYARDMGRWLREVIRDAGTDGIVIDQQQPGF